MAETSSIVIRDASLMDAEAMQAIYAPYVERTAITFEVEAPSAEEFRRRVRHTQEKYPWLVAERNGEVLGYAYLGEFKSRAAYAHSAETSIYVRMDAHGMGIGRALYVSLEERAQAMGLLNLNACIAYTETADDYLTDVSVRFHERMGYVRCAHFHQCARKFGHWYDMIWMEKLFERRKRMAENKQLRMKAIGQDFSVCKVKDYSQIDLGQPFVFTGSTVEEKSLVCPTAIVPQNTVERDDGWKALRIMDILDFSLIGILARISGILAENRIGIFAVSTFNTDYIFVKKNDFDKSIKALEDAGFSIGRD